MALVGSTNLGTTHRLELHLSQNSQNVTNNTSVVGYTLQIVRVSTSAGGYWNNNQSTATLTVNGTAITVPSFTYDFRSNYTKVLSTGSITVAHTADGTKTVAASASVAMNGGNIPSGSVSGSLALSTIPRASSFTIPSSYTMGNAFTATITRASSAFTHNITVKYGNSTLLSGTGYTTSASLNIKHTALYHATPKVTSAVLSVTMSTLSDGKVIGSSTKNITAYNGTRPTFTTITHSDSNTAISTRFGAYIQSKSRASLAITGAAASTGATIKSYKITVDGQVLNAASGTTQILKASGSLTVTGTVTDSRGFSISKSVTLSVLSYTPPAITSVSLQRVNSAGANDDYGTYGKFVLGYRVTPLDNKNSVSTKVKIGTVDTWAPQTVFTGTYTVQYGTFDVNNAYQAEFIVADYFGSTVSPQVLPTGAVTMMWGRDWISVGTAEGKGSGTINVRGDVFQNDKRVVDHNSVPDVISTIIDFNSYWKHGIVNMPSTANANSSSNSPGTGAGVLITRTLGDYTYMLSSTPYLQSWQTYQSWDGTISTRHMGTGSNGTAVWSAWKTELNTSTISIDNTKTASNYSLNGGPNSYTSIPSLSTSDKGIMLYYTVNGNGYMSSVYIPRQFFDTWFTVVFTTTAGYFQVQTAAKRITNSANSHAQYILKGYEIHK